MTEQMKLKVFAEVGGYMQHIGASGPDGWVEMQGERPEPDYAAAADGTWAHKPIVPNSVTRRQGRLALLDVGKLAAVESSIQSITDPVEQHAAQIEYEADTWDRSSAFLLGMWVQIGGTEAELDDLFVLAATK